MGTMILGMIARVSLGHSGRALQVGRRIQCAFALVIMAALIEFKAYRRQQLEIYDREIQRKKREEQWAEWERNAVPCPVHLKLAKAFVEEIQNAE